MSAPKKEAPEVKAVSDVPPSGGMKPIEKHAEELKTPDWVFAGVKVHKHWGGGHEVPRVEFEKACQEVCDLPIGVSYPYPVTVK